MSSTLLQGTAAHVLLGKRLAASLGLRREVTEKCANAAWGPQVNKYVKWHGVCLHVTACVHTIPLSCMRCETWQGADASALMSKARPKKHDSCRNSHRIAPGNTRTKNRALLMPNLGSLSMAHHRCIKNENACKLLNPTYSWNP